MFFAEDDLPVLEGFFMSREQEEGRISLDEWGKGGEIVAFNPVAYLWHRIEAENAGKEMDFEGMKDDLRAVVAETLLKAEFREIRYDVSFDDQGELIWLAPGHEGKKDGTVIDMAEATVKRYEKIEMDESLSREERVKAGAMRERFGWETEQLKRVIEYLQRGGEGQAVLGVLPDNDVVYPVSNVNYLTVYELKDGQIVVSPLMNRYSNRLMSSLFNKENLSEEEMILPVIDLGRNIETKEVFRKIDKQVNEEERQGGLVGELIDRTSDVADCDKVIDSAALFLEELIKLEGDRRKGGDNWSDIRGRLNIGWELAVKNIIGFISGEKYLNKDELMEKVGWYVIQTKNGFSRDELFRKIINEHDFQVLSRKVEVSGGACGSLNLPGMEGSLGGTSILNFGEKKMVKNCGQCGACINAEISSGYKCVSCGGVYGGC
mgnify:FL=1